jgi:hypothetical protein
VVLVVLLLVVLLLVAEVAVREPARERVVVVASA